jgi:ABC-2 type transport system ATP-binding protein
LLILDEPYNGLDPVGRYQMTELLKSLVASGKSVLFASHVLHEIEAVTSAFLLIYGGRLLASGTTAEIERILAGTPQEVVLHGDDAPRLIHRLADQPWVESLQLSDERRVLRVALRDATELYRSLSSWITEDELRIDRFESAGSNLAAVFECLLRHHRGES